MNNAKKILCFFVLMACIGWLVGCTGHLYTVKNPDFPNGKGKTDGVIVYLPQAWVVTFNTIQFIDENGEVSNKCNPETKYEFVTRPDYSTPYAIAYKPGLFETNTFSLTLEDGVLKTVNVTATSAAKETLEIIKETLGIAEQVASYAAKQEGQRLPWCNAGKKIIAIEPFSKYQQFPPPGNK